MKEKRSLSSILDYVTKGSNRLSLIFVFVCVAGFFNESSNIWTIAVVLSISLFSFSLWFTNKSHVIFQYDHDCQTYIVKKNLYNAQLKHFNELFLVEEEGISGDIINDLGHIYQNNICTISLPASCFSIAKPTMLLECFQEEKERLVHALASLKPIKKPEFYVKVAKVLRYE